MDELEGALRAVLSDPAQMQQLRDLAGAFGLSMPSGSPPSGAPPAAPAADPSPPPAAAIPASALGSVPPQAQMLLQQSGALGQKQQRLLQALLPFLRKERQPALERAIRAAQLAGLARLACKGWQSPGPKEGP